MVTNTYDPYITGSCIFLNRLSSHGLLGQSVLCLVVMVLTGGRLVGASQVFATWVGGRGGVTTHFD